MHKHFHLPSQIASLWTLLQRSPKENAVQTHLQIPARCKWKADRNKRHFIVTSLLPMGDFFWYTNQACFELWDTQTGLLANSSTQSSSVSKWQFRYKNAQSFLTNPTDATLFEKHCWILLSLCKDNWAISSAWCGKYKLKVLGLQHRHTNCWEKVEVQNVFQLGISSV